MAENLPVEDYDSLSASDAIQSLEGLDREELEEIRSHEAETRNRKTVLNAIDKELDGESAESSGGEKAMLLEFPEYPRAEVVSAEHNLNVEDLEESIKVETDLASAARPMTNAELLAAGLVAEPSEDDPANKAAIEDLNAQVSDLKEAVEDIEKDEPDSLREWAELSHSFPYQVDDPVGVPPIPESSNVDTFAQRASLAEAAAAPLREEVAESMVGRAENAGTHVVSGLAAEAGETWPPESEDPEVLAAQNQKETEETEEELGTQARAFVDRLQGEDKFTGLARGDTPESPSAYLHDDEEFAGDAIVIYSTPAAGGITVGTLVSRLDEAHDEIGAIVAIEAPREAGQVVVYFPSEGEVFLNVNNLAFEGSTPPS